MNPPAKGLCCVDLSCTKTHNDIPNLILNQVSFTFSGSINVIVGASGSGKSTLLRVLVGLDPFQQGELFLNGESYDEIAIQQWRRSVGLVLQLPYLFDGTVADNILYGPRTHQQHIGDETQFVTSLLESVHLEASLAERHESQLSIGQQMRVSIARTLANQPSVLLLDEPTASLDQETARHVIATLQEIHHRYKTTIVVVTHDPSVVQTLNAERYELEVGTLRKRGAH